MKNKIPFFIWTIIDKLYFIPKLLLLKTCNVRYESVPLMKGMPLIRNSGSISIGSNLRITSSLMANPTGGRSPTCLFTARDAVLEIGSNVSMSNCVIHVKHRVTIRDSVMLGGGVQIFDSDFHSITFKERMSANDKFKRGEVKIERGAFIGSSSVILKGVTIGEESVIGACSVVTCDIPRGEVWAGNPARYIRDIPLGASNE